MPAGYSALSIFEDDVIVFRPADLDYRMSYCERNRFARGGTDVKRLCVQLRTSFCLAARSLAISLCKNRGMAKP